MKFFSKISIFLLSAVIFMSAFIVFAEEQISESPDWPYLELSINISEQNKIKDNDKESLKAKISDAVSAPFFALTRDYPDLAMWVHRFSLTSYYSTSPTRPLFTLSRLDYTLHGYPNYSDPKGMLEQLQTVVDGFTPSGDTMYDKLKSIHDFICQTNTYVTGAPYCYTAYGALIDKKSVCEGYAEAFKLLCDKAGIDCILVTGMSLPDEDDTPEAHMWNIVRMDDGEWYAVDVTWDDAGDTEGNYSYFLVGNDTVIRGKRFEDSHLTCYDFIEIGGSGKTISNLEYPTLSSIAYDTENGQGEYFYSGERFHYDFLDDLQKEIYDKILAELRRNMPSDPSKTPNVETTDDTVTTTPETTTEPSQTSPEETTTEEETTTVVTTTPENTTSSEDTTTPGDTTDIPPETTTVTTETDPANTTPSMTAPPVSSSQTNTEPQESETTKKPDTTTNKTESDTTGKIETTPSITTSKKNEIKQNRDMHDLYKTVTAVVIFCAISSLSIILVIMVMRYAKKHEKR